MAQHIPVENIDNKSVQKIVDGIRAHRYFKTSMKYSCIPYEEYKETPSDEVYACHRRVPASVMSGGGRACFEIHTEPAENMGRKATNIYLVI